MLQIKLSQRFASRTAVISRFSAEGAPEEAMGPSEESMTFSPLVPNEPPNALLEGG
jgi:hypothetical protein